MQHSYKICPRHRWEDEARAIGVSIEAEFIEDGQKHRLSTSDKPHKQNVSYNVMDWGNGIKALFLCDYANPDRLLKLTTDLPRKNAKNLQTIEATLESLEKMRSEHFAQAMKKDREEYDSLPEAKDDNGYLQKKQVHTVPGLKQSLEGDLVVPLSNIDNEHCGTQHIKSDGTKRFTEGSQTKGSFFTIQGTKELIGFAEGIATGLSVHEALGCTVHVCFGASNLEAVSLSLAPRSPEARHVFFADNDIDNSDGNIGIISAKHAARRVGAAVVFPPALDECATDWNDFHARNSLEAVFAEVQNQLGINLVTKIPDDFELIDAGTENGLYQIMRLNVSVRLGAPLYITAMARTEGCGFWGRLVEWSDYDGVAHRCLIYDEDLAKEPAVVLTKLQGWQYDASKKSSRNCLEKNKEKITGFFNKNPVIFLFQYFCIKHFIKII